MKNRKLLIAVFLCFAMVVTGIGYAAISGHLKINGTAVFDLDAAEDGFMENIVFDETVTITGGGSAKTETLIDEATASEQTATFSVRTLAVQGEFVIFEYTLTNNNIVDANITIRTTHDDGTPNASSTFTLYEVDFVKVDGTTLFDGTKEGEARFETGASFLLEAGTSTTITVQVCLTDTPSTDIATEDFRLHLVATSVDE